MCSLPLSENATSPTEQEALRLLKEGVSKNELWVNEVLSTEHPTMMINRATEAACPSAELELSRRMILILAIRALSIASQRSCRRDDPSSGKVVATNNKYRVHDVLEKLDAMLRR